MNQFWGKHLQGAGRRWEGAYYATPDLSYEETRNKGECECYERDGKNDIINQVLQQYPASPVASKVVRVPTAVYWLLLLLLLLLLLFSH